MTHQAHPSVTCEIVQLLTINPLFIAQYDKLQWGRGQLTAETAASQLLNCQGVTTCFASGPANFWAKDSDIVYRR